MAEAAQLGANDFVFADFCRGEVKGKVEPGNEVLLDAKLANVEGMTDVFGVHQKLHLAVHGHNQLAGHNVASRYVIGRIEAEIVLIALVYLVGMDCAELPVGARVAEVKGKLLGLGLDLKGSGSRRGEINVGPGFLAHDAKRQDFRAHENESGNDQNPRATWKVLERAAFLAAGERPHKK